MTWWEDWISKLRKLKKSLNFQLSIQKSLSHWVLLSLKEYCFMDHQVQEKHSWLELWHIIQIVALLESVDQNLYRNI